MHARMPSTQKSIGTHYRSIEAQARKDGVDTGGYHGAAEFIAAEMKARPQRLQQAAARKAANPKAWKGWTTADIARTIPTYTRDEDGEIWA